jgi:hypothetical protein
MADNPMPLTDEKIAWLQHNKRLAGGTTAKVAGDTGSEDLPQAFGDAPSRARDVRFGEGDGAPPTVPVQPAPGQASPTLPGPGTPQAVNQAKDSAAKKYKVKSVSDGDAAWTENEINTVSDAFAKIPDADKDVLAGIEVKRVHAIDAEHAAQFSTETKVDENTPATQTNAIEVGDSTFSRDGLPVSAGEQRRVIVHEVAHAVASRAQRKADLEDDKAIERENTAIAAENTAIAEYNDVNDKRNALISESNDLVAKYNAAVTALNAANAAQPPDPDTVKAANDAFKAAKAALDAKKQEVAKITAEWKKKNTASDNAKAAVGQAKAAQSRTAAAAAATRVPDGAVHASATQVTSAATVAASAKQSADAAAGQMSDADQNASEDYRKAVAAVAAQLKSYGDAIKAGNPDMDGHEKDLASALADRAKKRQSLDQSSNSKNPALAAFIATETAQDDLAVRLKTQARLPNRSLSVQRFVDIVEKNNIQPDTPYARQNWPFAPEEFFAEAYSIWRTNPDKLKADAKPLFDWFENGRYR